MEMTVRIWREKTEEPVDSEVEGEAFRREERSAALFDGRFMAGDKLGCLFE